MERDSQQQKAD